MSKYNIKLHFGTGLENSLSVTANNEESAREFIEYVKDPKNTFTTIGEEFNSQIIRNSTIGLIITNKVND